MLSRRSLLVGMNAVLDPASENRELSIPVCEQDLELVQAVRTWPSTLHSLGLEISTGPVVPFRATSFLMTDANWSFQGAAAVDAARPPHANGLAL